MRDVGLDAHWQVIMGREEFFNATKLLHNSLQGDPNTLTPNQWELFDHYNKMNADSLEGEWDVIIVHDPQPVGMRHDAKDHAKNWVWRCHIDLSEPNPEPIERLLPLISEYDITVWHMEQYVPNGLDGHGGVRIVPPAIDPLSPKNMALSPDDAAFVCNQFGIDVDRPLICQVSRFDPWKDPIGVIDAYRQVTKEIPEVQLALVGSMATDDPEGWEFFHRTFEYAGSDPDIKILNNLNNVGAIEVNAFQSQSDVVLQKSIREGFGLTVAEALWKGRPTIGGDVGGIPLQIVDGEDGYLVSSPDEARRALRSRSSRTRSWAGAWPRRQGAHPRALPDARACCSTGCGSSPTWIRAAACRGSRRADTSGACRITHPLTIVSNRGPAEFGADEGGNRIVHRGGGGLVTALSGLVSHRNALWIASAMTEEDVVVASENDGPVEIELDGISYDVQMVASNPAAYDRFYNVIANPILWFIQHYLWDLSNAPDIRQAEVDAWEEGYKVVNDDIADA